MLSDKLTFLVSSFVLLSLSFSHYLLPLITELKKFFKEQKKTIENTKWVFLKKALKNAQKAIMEKSWNKPRCYFHKITLWLWSFILLKCQKTSSLLKPYVPFIHFLQIKDISYFTNGLLFFCYLTGYTSKKLGFRS